MTDSVSHPDTVLQVSDLTVQIAGDEQTLLAVKALDLAIRKGQTFALVGESGCGKSMTALALLRLLPDAAYVAAGRVRLDGDEVMTLSEQQMRSIRGGRAGIIFQEPSTSLNPVMTVGRQLMEVLREHTEVRGAGLRERAAQWLDRVGIPDAAARLDDYPFQFSGGQKQRVMIAIALAAEPRLLIADEPTTALDVTVQGQILALLQDIQKEMGLAVLLITHDLAVVKNVADHVALMRAGEIVETRDAAGFFAAPRHPYARQLLAAIPSFAKRGERLSSGDAGGPLEASGDPGTIFPSVGRGRDGKAGVALAEPPVRDDHDARADGQRPAVGQPALHVRDLSVSYVRKPGLFRRSSDAVPIVRGVSFDLKAGETLVLLGESGCGKTTTAKALLRLLDRQASIQGRATLNGQDLLAAHGRPLRRLRRDIQIVFQDPYASLDPRMLVGDILDEGIAALRPELDRRARRSRMSDLLDRVGLPRNTAERYPHEFSGGQRQRIAIARALAVNPTILVCDEPTSALDVSVQAQILELLQDLQRQLGIAYLFITHNFGVVEYLADHIAVMHEGRIVEAGTAERVLLHPQHAETRRLIDAVPRL